MLSFLKIVHLLTFLFLLLFVSVLTLLAQMDKSPQTFYPSFSFRTRSNCSFNDISVCQSAGPGTNGSFLYIIWGSAGFGSELNQLLLAFAYSVASKRQFVIESQQWNYGKFSDFFDFYPKTYNRSLNWTFLVENNRENEKIPYLKTTRVGLQVGRFWRATRYVQTIEAKRPVAHYLWQRMSENTSKFVEECRVTIPLNYIAIHVRRGDKISREANAVPLINYVNRIEQVFGENRSETVFVASDAPSVISEFRQLRPNWIFFDRDINGSTAKFTAIGHRQGVFNRLSLTEKSFQTNLLICQLQILIDAPFVFCTMSSNICRLIQILRHQPLKSVLSLDQPWRGT